MKYQLLAVIVLVLGTILFSGVSSSQTPTSSEFWISVQDDDPGGFAWYLVYGNHTRGSYGIDSLFPAIIEYVGPPLSPGLDVRWKNVPGRPYPSYGSGLINYDFRSMPANPAKPDTFVLYFFNQSWPNANVTIKWPKKSYLTLRCDSLFLIDPTRQLARIDMFQQDSLYIVEPQNYDQPITRLYIVKYGVKRIDPGNPPGVILTSVREGGDYAIFEAVVTPNGLSTHAEYFYGTDPMLTSSSSGKYRHLGAGFDWVLVKDTVTGLTPGATYYYKISAHHTEGSAESWIWSFYTSYGLLPEPVTLTPSVVSVNSAWVMGELSNTGGLTTNVFFQYGTSFPLGMEVPAEPNPVMGWKWDQQVSVVLSNLSPNTTYYYRLLAENDIDRAYGDVLSFQTRDILIKPQIISITDVPNDQGGRVTLYWTSTFLDTNIIEQPYYSIWRAVPVGGMENSIRSSSLNESINKAVTPQRLKEINGVQYIWEWIGNQPSHKLPEYSYTAQTLYDSASLTDGKHYFFISAHTSNPNVFYDSDIEVGYSVDNLAPMSPLNLIARQSNGSVILEWLPCQDADLKQYILYRGWQTNQMQEFTRTIQTSFVDPIPLGIGAVYGIRAEDIHGNLSEVRFATVVTGIEKEAQLPTEYQLDQNYPNPFNPKTTLKYSLPEESYVTLTIYNIMGQSIVTLIDGVESAGYKSLDWDAMGVASGIYFYRLEATSTESPNRHFAQVRTMLVLK